MCFGSKGSAKPHEIRGGAYIKPLVKRKKIWYDIHNGRSTYGSFDKGLSIQSRELCEEPMLGTDTIAEVGGSGTIRVRLPSSSPAPVDKGAAEAAPLIPFSPRIKTDPIAGVMIAEYLSTMGEKEIQIPSQTVVAYLRSGLTATGMPERRESETTLEA